MPWGWECRAKLIKQRHWKPTERRRVKEEVEDPGPSHYEVPEIFCGTGYNKIRRAPAYTFGLKTKPIAKPSARPNAPMFNTCGQANKGSFRITHSVLTPHIEPVSDKTKNPGPAAYFPSLRVKCKKPTAYSIRMKAKPPYQPFDMWTPPPNMYHLPLTTKREPAFTLGHSVRETKMQQIPGPTAHAPNFNFVKRNKPAYSFGGPHRQIKPPKSPAPNVYCEKKFMVIKRSIPAPTFGIRHTPFLGKHEPQLKPSNLDVAL